MCCIAVCVYIEADHDFEPTAEHMIHDYDDEATMEEEENMSNESGDNDELDDLQKVDMNYCQPKFNSSNKLNKTVTHYLS